jgi:hypothetical protein
MVERAISRMETDEAKIGGRSLFRPLLGRALSARNTSHSLSARQSTVAVFNGSSDAKGGQAIEIVDVASNTAVVPVK